MFEKVTIIGFGLIGSSMARAIRENKLAGSVVAVDADKDVCRIAMDLGIADDATTDLAEGVADADLVVLAVPVAACGDVARHIRAFLKKGAILTDVGSVKGAVIENVSPHVPDNVQFVPAHPIAGTENSGPESGFAALFAGRWCIVTPMPETDIRAVEKVTKLWEGFGSEIEIMDPKRHDLVLAITSHLPHLIAYTIVGTASDLETHMMDDVIKFSASGFRDFTRIAASNPVMWRDIFLENKDAVLEILQRFNEDLTALQRAIRWEDGAFLEQMFIRTRDIKKEIVKAGQADYATPTGSQEAMPIESGPKKASGSAS